MDISKLNPEVYREAAIRILERDNNYCCFAIDGATQSLEEESEHCEFFTSLMKPTLYREVHSNCWWNSANPYKNERAFALLLCADILESEQKAQRSRKR